MYTLRRCESALALLFVAYLLGSVVATPDAPGRAPAAAVQAAAWEDASALGLLDGDAPTMQAAFSTQ
jgi:hypothetical protein